MANDIKQKIVLEGEKEYNRALSDAKRNLKTLRSELKAETAELGANATAQQKNEVKVKSLQKQIKEQEKVVKTYKDALNEVKEKYSDNEEAIAKWEQKLNDARTGLANMKNELENVGKGFKDIESNAAMATVATKSVADAFGQIGDFGNAVSDSIEGIFNGLIDTLKSALTEIWGMIADTAAKANNWTDLASYYGTTASEIERMNYAVEASHGDFQNFTNLLNQLSWGGKEKKITEWFGVSDANYTDKLDYAMAVLQQMAELQRTDPGKLGDAMEDVFGAKKSQQIMWFVSNLEKIRENMGEFDEHGYGLGEEEIARMNDVYFNLGEIENKWDKLKEKFAAGFGQVTLDIQANVSGALDALADYFNAENDEERNKALDALTTNITEAFQRVADAIQAGIEALDKVAENLKNSDNPTAQAIGGILSGLVDALKWITEDNMKHVVSAFEILAAFWLTGRGLAFVSTITKLVANLASIQTFKLLSNGGDIAKAAASAGSASGAGWASAFAAAAKATITTVAPWLLSVLGVTAVSTVGAFAVQADTEKQIEERRATRLEAASEMMGEAAMWLEKTANVLGASRDENGNINRNLLGQAILQGNEQDIYDILMGMNDRSDLQKAQLYNLLNGSFTSQGNDTWSELQRLWSGEGEFNNARLAAILESIADAYTLRGAEDEWWRRNGGNSGETDGLTSADAKTMTDAVNKMPSAVAKGMSGIRVTLDGQTVGHLVAPYVSTLIASGISI